MINFPALTGRGRGGPVGSVDRDGAAHRLPPGANGAMAWRFVAKAIGARVRLLREERNIAASELAAATCISVMTIHTIERGARCPRLQSLLAIAAALRCTLVDLLPDEAHHVLDPDWRSR